MKLINLFLHTKYFLHSGIWYCFLAVSGLFHYSSERRGYVYVSIVYATAFPSTIEFLEYAYKRYKKSNELIDVVDI